MFFNEANGTITTQTTVIIKNSPLRYQALFELKEL